jgi:hypothetical protein
MIHYDCLFAPSKVSHLALFSSLKMQCKVTISIVAAAVLWNFSLSVCARTRACVCR